MRKINVNVSKSYEVLIGRGIFDEFADLIKPVCRSNRIAIVTDDVVAGLYLDQIERKLRETEFKSISFVFPNGEHSKNIHTLSDILEFLAENHIRRNDTLIALGGGVVGDITGMAAAVYMRGISVIHVPTTLLSAVDSSVGGKTAIDLRNGKNLAGAFWQPSMVVCDVDIIDRLPDNTFAEGMAEVIKCNVIKELPIIGWIEEETLKNHLEEVIFYCVSLKREIVEQDEYDAKCIRNILNVGHTVAHAIEKLSDYTISHGKAVGTGLVIEAKIAEKLGLCNENVTQTIRGAVDKYGLIVDTLWKPNEMVEAMKSDKKNRDLKIVFELPESLGRCKEIRFENNLAIDLLATISPKAY